MRLARAHLLVVGGLLASITPAAAQGGAGALMPFQLVRSLQLVQDRIAGGDHAALPMQRKLLEMIDKRLRDAGREDFEDVRNFRAMLIYAMSGGNPATIDVVLSRLDLDDTERSLGYGIMNYLNGRQKDARDGLSAVNPLKEPPELGAFLALIKGTIATGEDPAGAIKLFDQARLLGSGTLVEEAALRRSIALSPGLGDTKRFLHLSSQYVRRFLRSPYASQFADSFVAGVLELDGVIDMKAVDEIVAGMEAEQRKVIYLRLARRSAIEGRRDLSAFASSRAEGSGGEEKQVEDPRAVLYSALSTVTSANVEDLLGKLATIDRARLSANDLLLLDAVIRVATDVQGALPPVPEPAVRDVSLASEAPQPGPDPEAAADTRKPEQAATDLGPAEEDIAAVRDAPASPRPAVRNVTALAAPEPAAPAPSGPAPAAPEPHLGQTAGAPAAAETEGADAATEEAAAAVSEARKKLAAVDKLLGETAQ